MSARPVLLPILAYGAVALGAARFSSALATPRPAGAARARVASDERPPHAADDRERVAALSREVPALDVLWQDHFAVSAPANQVVVAVGRQCHLGLYWRHASVIPSR